MSYSLQRKDLSLPWKKNYNRPRHHIKKWRHHFADKALYSQSKGFSSSQTQTWELDHKEGWVLKNWYFQTVVLEKILESPLNSNIKPVNPKRNQPWNSLEGLDAEAETPVLWAPDMKSLFIGKETDPGRVWGQKEKGETEDKMGWHCWLNGHEFE